MRNKVLSLFSFSILLGSFTGCLAADDEDVSSSSDDLLGAPVDHHNLWSVGVCAGPLNQDPMAGPVGACLTSGTRCTGSLVARNMVMTARHCVQQIDYSNATSFCTGVFTTTPLTDAGVRITTDLSVIGENVHWMNVAEVIVPAGNESCANDIAFLRLAHPVSPFVAHPVAVDVRDLTTHQPIQVAVVGRGVISEVFNTTDYSVVSIDTGGLKRRVRQHIDFECVSNTFGDCVAEDIGAPFEADTGYAQFASSTASGDSGSGVVRQASFAAHSPVLVGVDSAGTADPMTGIPNHGFATRLDQHRAFIKSTLRYAPGANVID